MLGLGRGTNKGCYVAVIDPDVQAFVDSEGITNQQEINALSNAAKELKGNNSLSYDFWSDISYSNFISPTGLIQSESAINVILGQPKTATEIGVSPTLSDDGLLFDSTNCLNLGDTTGNIPREKLAVLLAFSNNATVNGRSFGKVIDDGDTPSGNWARTQCYRQNNSGNMGFLYGNTTGLVDRVGIWCFSNDGTNHAIWKDGVKLALTTTAIVNGELTGSQDDYLAARNGDALGVAGVFQPQDDRVTTCITFNMGTLYTNAHHEVLAQIINRYNTNVV